MRTAASATGHSESTRQLVHIAMGGFAFALAYLTWWQAALLAGAAVLVNVSVLPVVAGRHLYRPGEIGGGRLGGIVLYPLAVLLLVLTFRERLDIVAAAWGILAAGDGLATLAGRAIGGPRVPWNQGKSFAGSATFVVAGTVAAAILLWWTREAIPADWAFPSLLVAAGIAALLAALAETAPIRLDDNVSTAATSAAALWFMSRMSSDAWLAAAPAVAERWPWALAVNTAAAGASVLARTITPGGALAGWFVGTAVYIGGGAGAWLLLLACFVVATGTSRLGLHRKAALGIAEQRGGRRGPGNVLANCGLAAAAAIAAVTAPDPDLACLVLGTALVAGASDTAASEVGKAFGTHTFLVSSWRRVPPGTSGAVSLEGTLAGIAAAVVLGLIAAAGGVVPAEWVAALVAGAVVGGLVESYVGATLEEPGILNNDAINFVLTAVSSIVAVVLVGLT